MRFIWATLLLGTAAVQASPLVILAGRTDPNLTAQVQNYSLSGNDFTFTLFSVNGVLASGSITGIGFDFQDNGALNTATLMSSTNSNFSLANGPLAATATGLSATL